MRLGHVGSIPILILVLACTGGKEPETAKALLEQAKTSINEANYVDAIKNLRNLVEKYPQNAVAAEAQYVLGDTYMAYAKDFQQSVKEYRTVVSVYPQSRFAVNAQFMIGYIYANFIKDYEVARKEYETFLELYSDRADSNLIQSVHFELENLGRDLNEVPQLRHITS